MPEDKIKFIRNRMGTRKWGWRIAGCGYFLIFTNFVAIIMTILSIFGLFDVKYPKKIDSEIDGTTEELSNKADSYEALLREKAIIE